ncbi:glutathione S-transferase-like [Adelges cooleyi]|uniref:glutathione S-transferase-like n=1 Tax=Adelges cooleyi TaxID=133065 RepID=UPI00217FB8B3|nr:glutathione S-transferase-like [Adelges cooleyi]
MSYKLTYFDVPGLAEPIRFLMAYLDIDFEDNRIGYQTWSAVKPSMPFGKVPILEIDGQVLNQSSAITRYLARKAGLAGIDDWESMLIDIAVDNVHDFRHEIAVYVFTERKNCDAESNSSKIKEITKFYMEKFESIVTINKGFFVNGKLTWADLFFVAISDTLSDMAKIDILEGRPNLQTLKTQVLSIPQIKTWVAKRPEPSVLF